MRRYSNVSWSTIALIISIVISTSLPVGIAEMKKVHEEYSLPIYISKELEVNGYSSYTVTGELTNYTNNTVIIEKLEISIYGYKNKVLYVARPRLTIYDIIIDANSTYSIYESDLVYSQDGMVYAKGELTDANISDCIINGESVELKKFEAGYFISQRTSSNGYIIYLIVGSIAITMSVAIIIFKIVKHFN